MARLDDLIAERIARIDSVPDAFYSTVGQQQRAVMRRMQQLMAGMDTVGGNLAFNEANVARISEIVNELINEDLMQGEYRTALREYLRQFGIQGDINDAIFGEIIDNFTVNPNWRLAIQEAQRTTLQALGTNGINTAFGEPIRKQLLASVTNGMGLEEATAAIRVFIEGNEEVLGVLQRYAGQIAYDSFAFTDRSYAHLVAEDLDVQWFRYQGGQVKDSRDFCIQRLNKIYHRTEIEQWASLTWGGKAKGTDAATIWSYAGGYRCMHTFVPVIASEVPDDVKARITT